MRVICVQSFILCQQSAAYYNRPLPEVGTEYIVVDQYESDQLFYFLAGFPKDCCYLARAFATLPSATADEMAEAEREAIFM